jgi:hypothetical protein
MITGQFCIHRFRFNNSSKEKKNVSNSINPWVIFEVLGERGWGRESWIAGERIAKNSKFTYLVVLNPMCLSKEPLTHNSTVV